MLLAGCDVVYLNQKTKMAPAMVAKAYFTLNQRLKITTLREMIAGIAVETSWAQEAVDSLEDEMRSLLAELTLQFLTSGKDIGNIDKWLEARHSSLQAVDLALADIDRMGSVDLPLITVAVQRLRRLVVTGASHG
jgi:NAD-specific glutamate dehydrogenase